MDDHHVIEKFERGWMVFALAMLVVFMVLVLHAVFTHGENIARTTERAQPSEILAQERFAQPGVEEVAPGEFEVHMVAQAFSFMPGEVYLPEGAEATFYVTSRDVIHGYKVQHTNINVELIPGEVSTFRHTFREPGEHHIVCNQYCGIGHHNMQGKIVVESEAQFAERQAGMETPSAEAPAAPARPSAPQRGAGSVNLRIDDLPDGAHHVTITAHGEDGSTSEETLYFPEDLDHLEVTVFRGDEAELEEGAPAPEPTDTAAAAFDWEARGERVYSSNCSSCHQAQGQGLPGAFPPLAGRAGSIAATEGGREYLIQVLLYGLQGSIQADGQRYNGVMPAWPQLSDEDIAAALNHITHSWGSDAQLPAGFEPIQPGEVAAERGQGLSASDVQRLRQQLGID